MSLSELTQIEERVSLLPVDEQLRLIERITHRLRKDMVERIALDNQLAAMAADPEIQGQLGKIEEEFSFAEADGLGEGR